MNKLDIFPTEVFWFDWGGDVEALLEHTKKQNLIPLSGVADQSKPYIHLLDGYKELFTWIDECSEEIRTHYQLHCDKLSLTTAWINRYQPKQFIHYHRHPLAAFSGVFFLTGGAPLVLKDPNIWRTNHSTIPISRLDRPQFELEPIPGRAVMFPWWLEHGSINTLDSERWSIAFNTMPSGKINYDDGHNLSSAELEVAIRGLEVK